MPRYDNRDPHANYTQFKYVYKNGNRKCITQPKPSGSEPASAWTNFKLFPDLTNYTYTGEKVSWKLGEKEFSRDGSGTILRSSDTSSRILSSRILPQLGNAHSLLCL